MRKEKKKKTEKSVKRKEIVRNIKRKHHTNYLCKCIAGNTLRQNENPFYTEMKRNC